jgi:uncharacterized protein (TIGR03437 family)
MPYNLKLSSFPGGALMISERQRWVAIFVAKAILVCGCAPLALYGQGNPTATWTGQGNDGSWANGKNWQWTGDNNQCETTSAPGTPANPIAIPPATLNVGSPCYYANVVIGANFTVNEDEQGSSYIVNFTLGATSTLNGSANGTGNTTIGLGAIVNGQASAGSTSGVLTNQGTIFGSVSGATVINTKDGWIHAFGAGAQVFAPTQGTNAGLIEATAAGGTASVALAGPWNNSGGTIQIDSGTVLVCDATVTGGNFNVASGGSVGAAGNGLTIAGSVNSTGFTIDAPGATASATITGTLTIAGNLIVGNTGGVSTVMVNGGKLVVNGGSTTMGVQAAATGQLEISGTSQVTTGNLTLGPAGTGYMSVASGAIVTSGNVIMGGSNTVALGSGTLVVSGGVMNYSQLQVNLSGVAPGEPAAIWVYLGGNLIGKQNNGQIIGPFDSLTGGNAIVTGSHSVWKTQNPLYISGGGLTISDGGGVSVSPTLPGPSFIVDSQAAVSGTGSTLAASHDTTMRGKLNITAGAKATFGFLSIGEPHTPIVQAGLTGFAALAARRNSSGSACMSTGVVDGAGTILTATSSAGTGIFCNSGSLTVQNQAKLSTPSLGVSGTDAKLSAQTKGAISTSSLQVQQGNAMIENAGALQLTGNQPSISVGDGTAPAVLIFSGSGENAGTLTSSGASAGVFPNGTLQIASGDSITISGPVSLSGSGSKVVQNGSTSNLPGGTINVTNGALGIGSIAGAIKQGWVTVGPGGILRGGSICPQQASIEGTTCIPDSLVGQGTMNASVVNDGGSMLVDPAILNITQAFQQTGGSLGLTIDGTQSAQVSQVRAGGAIQITGGAVEFDFTNGFAPGSGDKFNVLSASNGLSVSGASFTTTGLASGFNYTTGTSNSQFNLAASSSGTATTSAPAPPPTPTLASSDSASGAMELAPGSLASGYGTGLAAAPGSAPDVWPAAIGGTSVSIVDATGTTSQAGLLYVSPTEVDYQIPDTVGLGPATVTVTAGDGTTASGPINVLPYAPGLFAVNSAGLSASFADCVTSDGGQTTILTSQVVNGALVAVPLNLGACQQTVLELWTTGLDEAETSNVEATIGGLYATVLYAGPQGAYPGVDQVNVVVPQSLAGAGNVPIVLSIGGVTSNTVNVTIQ